MNGPIGDIAALYLGDGRRKAWRSTGIARSSVILRERKQQKRFVVENGRIGVLSIVSATGADRTHLRIENDDRLEEAWAYRRDGTRSHSTTAASTPSSKTSPTPPPSPKAAPAPTSIRAPMAGRIVKVTAEPGATVVKGQLLVILEAMKMEHELRAAADGIVDTVTAKQGDQVSIRQTLVSLKTA